jgi:hypothetical protein
MEDHQKSNSAQQKADWAIPKLHIVTKGRRRGRFVVCDPILKNRLAWKEQAK